MIIGVHEVPSLSAHLAVVEADGGRHEDLEPVGEADRLLLELDGAAPLAAVLGGDLPEQEVPALLPHHDPLVSVDPHGPGGHQATIP